MKCSAYSGENSAFHITLQKKKVNCAHMTWKLEMLSITFCVKSVQSGQFATPRFCQSRCQILCFNSLNPFKC